MYILLLCAFPGSLSLFVASPLIMLWQKKKFTQNERENTAKVKKKYDENVAFSL